MKTLDSMTARLGICFGLAATLWSADPILATTLTVSTTNDNGAGSLRQAIADAAPGDTIEFSVTGTITLTNGELVIGTNLNVCGPSAALLAVSGGGASRVFNITAGMVNLSGLTIANGRSTNGGGLYNDAGTVTVLGCTFATNSAIGNPGTNGVPGGHISDVNGGPGENSFGGAIFNGGSLLVSNSSFQGNIVRGGNGGSGGFTLGFGGPGGLAGGGFGGAICSTVMLCVINSTLSGNAATGGTGGTGAGSFSPAGAGGMGGEGGGGGLYTSGSASLVGNTFNGNAAVGGGGGAGGWGFSGGSGGPGGSGASGGSGLGGGIRTRDGTLNLTINTFAANSAAGGTGGIGGVGGAGSCYGGGPGNGGNGGNGGHGFGGAIDIFSGTVNSHSSTVASNGAFAGAGGSGGPGGTCPPPRAGSGSPGSGGMGGSGVSGGISIVGSTTRMQNTIIAGNRAATGNPDMAGITTSQGHNLIGVTNDSSGWVATDLTGTSAAPLDPKLRPLQDNGGPTFTMALLPGSPAIDAGSSPGLASDQRGRLRLIDDPAIPNTSGGDGSDIGAFELQSQAITLAPPAKSGSDIVISFLSEIGQRYQIERKDSLATGSWTNIAGNVAGTGATVQVIDPDAASLPKRFYRAKTLP